MEHSAINILPTGVRTCSTVSLALLLISACAPLQQGQQLIGMREADVQARFGAPTDTFYLADGTHRWIYSTQPLGSESYAATFYREGRLGMYKQMLQYDELNKAIVGNWTKRDVEEHFGRSREPVQYFRLMAREVWTYRVGQTGDWHVLYHFYFDAGGVLRNVQVTPDPLFEVLT
ncbi:hypothetical protein [Cupriavidus basilensis]|uniref:hypothetical protein n=1 Tax=Cupriavidus basilensis TaxID=68895 RepID=UPI00157B8B8C|nr:hypothetical protein [Cupriavidus basilensis]NUA26914.1 hypothetical protein [Cupriavidus basilensis]